MNDRNEYAKWLTSIIGNRQSYHNHKETMAWVITALYLPGIVYLGYIEGQIWRGLGWERMVIGLITFAGCLVWRFANMQFRNRWEAADVIKVLLHHLVELNSGVKPPTKKEWVINDKEKHDWPDFVQIKLNKLKEKRKFWKHPLKFFADDRGLTESISYTAIFLTTLFAILLAWN